MSEGLERQIQAAVTGRQAYIRGLGTTATVDDNTKLSGQTLVANTVHVFMIPVAGAAAVDVTLRISAHTGTAPTPKIEKVFLDGSTVKGSATNFAILVDNTLQTVSISDLRGEKFVKLTITTPAASTATFDMAEYSTL